MKKIISILVALMLVSALAISVSAVSGRVSLSTSAGTLYSGDTFTVTATLNSSDAIAMGTVLLIYDTEGLEMIGGSCHVSGTSIGDVYTKQDVGTFMLSGEPRVVSGKIFTFQMKVKEGAPVGYYTIISNASIGVDSGESISSGSVTVTVECHHSYGDWTEGDGVCQQICDKCGDVKTAEHKWNKDANSVDATCKEDGIHYFTCSVCGAKKEELDPQTDDHTFGNLTAVDDEYHKDTCSVCQKDITEKHTWNSGKITKPATCKETGVKTYTCTGCKHTKTEVIELSTIHTWSKWEKVDADTHSRVCTVCDLPETGNHSYKTSWSKDSKEHWHECADCKDKKDVEAHIPGAEATETTAQTCKTCNYILKAALGHTHDYAEEWTTDETGHWYTCTGCEEKGEYADHDFENPCDPDCSICGYTREAGHSFGTEWVTDAENHWYACAGCEEVEGQQAHTPGAAATETTAQTCTACGYELAPALGVLETEPAATTPAVTEPADGDGDKDGDLLWWIIPIVIILLGVVVFFFVKKRR